MRILSHRPCLFNPQDFRLEDGLASRRFGIAVYNLGVIGGLLDAVAVSGVGIYGPTFGVLAAAALRVVA